MHLGDSETSTGEIIRALKQRPDEIMLEIGAGGELLVARIRLACALLLLLLPIANYFLTHSQYESMAGLLGASSALAFSALWLKLAKQSQRRPWLGFVSSALDITMVTAVLIILAQSQLAAALNSVVVWCCYPLAILATALRNDARVSVFAGVLAIVQFGLLSLIIMGMNDGTISSIEYGTVSVSTQIQRIILLIAITALTVVVVFRMQRLVQLSGTDALTGLPNRLYLNHHVPQLLAAAQKQNTSVSMVIIDLDLFKRINDELGHSSGDKAIRHAVNIIRNECGKHEPMIRIGGEEFLLVIGAPMGAAWERMEALRKRLEANPFEPGGQKLPRILTFSAGIASTPHDANTVSDLLKVADKRLKIAKAQGRNRVIARD
jgi:two-component system, cell cycle response regulator